MYAGRGGYTRAGAPRGGFGSPGTARGYANGEDDGRVQTCYKCGGPNHFARDCHAKSVKCYACGKFEGHIVPSLTALHLISSHENVHMQTRISQRRQGRRSISLVVRHYHKDKPNDIRPFFDCSLCFFIVSAPTVGNIVTSIFNHVFLSLMVC